MTRAAAVLLTVALGAASNAADPPLITHTTDRNDYTIRFQVFIKPSRDASADRFALTMADIYFPFIESTSSSTGDPNSIRTQFWWRKQIATEEFRILPAVPGFGRFGAVEFRADRFAFRGAGVPSLDQTVTEEVRFQYEFASVNRETVFDEKRAAQIPWPQEFPPELRAWLQPEVLIQSTHPAIVALVNEWTGANPRALGPVMLAKQLCGHVVDHMMPTEPAFGNNTRGGIAGIDVQGAAFAAVEKSGSVFDMAALLVAVYRAAGIPARLVVGLDVERTNRQRTPAFQAWVEFALLDPSDNRVEWIPVDVVRQRSFSSRAPRINQPWEYFGNNRFLDTAMPLSFHFHPPDRAVGSGGIVSFNAHALWGWTPSPLIAEMDQTLNIVVMGTPQRGGR